MDIREREPASPQGAEAPIAPRAVQAGEASSGLWRRVGYRRAVIEAAAIFALWRLLALVPITFWPPALFPVVLLALLALRFLPPVWAALRLIATKREKMSRRFFRLALDVALICGGVDALAALAVGEPAQPFGGPTFGPDLPRFFATHHHLDFGAFLFTELAMFGLLLVYSVIAVICTRLAQGGFLRFTMPSGNGRVTL